MTTAIDASVSPLSKELKTATAVAHERAEHSTYMQDLLDGKLDVAAFILLQEQSWFFYRAMERAGRLVADQPIAASIVDPALERTAALEHDLDHLHGNTTWRETVTMLPETAAYVERLNEIAEDKDAARLVAHHYVRYLGDLSGGQVIGRMMQRHYNVDDESVSFYRFADIPKVKPYKDRYREALDALPLTEADRERLITEACDAFIMNFNLFAALGREVGIA